jgi:hypothetical protein
MSSRTPDPAIGSEYGNWRIVSDPIRVGGRTKFRVMCAIHHVLREIEKSQLVDGRARRCDQCYRESVDGRMYRGTMMTRRAP